MSTIDQRASDGMSVAPEDEGDARSPLQDAGRDKSIAKRLEKNPDSQDARLDAGLDESMDASDPPAAVAPANSQEPPESSGYDEDAERQRRDRQ